MPFPHDFLWGAATSAYQVEGAATEDGRAASIWDYFATQPGRTFEGQTGERAADHYHRVEQDVALMAQLGLNAYRFSIAWPRVVPTGRGPVNAAGLDFYSRLVDALLAQSITPVVTLYHWDLPVALYDKGGWRNRETAYAFAEYAEVVAARLGDRVRWWVTQNEPWCAAYLGHVDGTHAPGIHGDAQAAVEVGHHLLLSHGLAVPRIRANSAHARVGASLNLFPIFAGDRSPDTARAVQQADRFHNSWFLHPLYRHEYPAGLFEDLSVAPPPMHADDMDVIGVRTDFLGVNYYNRHVVCAGKADSRTPEGLPGVRYTRNLPGAQITEMGWEVYPHGLSLVLEEVHRAYAVPALMVTENGAAFMDTWNGNGRVVDTARLIYLREHVHAVESALEHGVPVAGYMVWSLLDNFEWGEGYSKRFGLVYVDFETQHRVIKDSGRWYAGFIAGQQALHTR